MAQDLADDPTPDTVAELGESEVLRRILARLGEAEAARLGPGDDCAVLAFDGDGVVTTDTMIEGIDFRLDWHSGRDLGHKLAATNLSDIAAMGARPTALTVALACPPGTPVALLEEIARGLDEACRELAPGCGVVGGDLARSPVLTAAVTALGDLSGRPPVTRSGARAGDVVAYAGELGLSGIGLSILLGTKPDLEGNSEIRDVALAAHLTPRPPVTLGVAAADAGATAMLDVSDGLALDAARIARASGVTLELDSALLLAGFGGQGGGPIPIDAMLFGGEDHGLLATFPSGASLPDRFRVIGRAREGVGERGPRKPGAGEPYEPLLLDGRPCEPRGWDPFTSPTGSA